MSVEKMSGIYIPGAKIPDGDYVRVLMLHKDGTCVDGIGNVFKVIPVPPHGRLGDLDEFAKRIERERFHHSHTDGLAARHHVAEYGHFLNAISEAPTIIQAEEGER